MRQRIKKSKKACVCVIKLFKSLRHRFSAPTIPRKISSISATRAAAPATAARAALPTMASPTADPFEGPVAPAVREDAVREAVAFLNDPRVKAADPARAQAFLQQKGMAPAEVREAFRRCALPLPPSAGAVRAFAAPPQQLVVPPPREGRSWFGVFMGVVAAAGLYTAVREVLKRYVVPLYFPDAARVAEERRRREEAASRQERQLGMLRLTIRVYTFSSLCMSCGL